MNCNSNHSLFLRSNGTLVCWDDHGSLKDLQPFDPAKNYATDIYLGPVYEHIRARLTEGVMPFPEHCAKCFCLMTHIPMDDGRHRRERTIETFQIEPSMACQLECPGCIRKSDRRHRVARTPFGHMTLDPEILAKIVLDLKNAGVKIGKFDLQGHGEPLLNKKIWRICGFLAEHYPDSIISICTHANARFEPHMVASGVTEMLFAIDGVDQASYAPWRVHGNFDQAYRFMHDFAHVAAARAPHIDCIWKYVLFSHNDSDAQLLKAQELARAAKITSLRFVATQLGPASSRIQDASQIPRLDPLFPITVDSYRIDAGQLTAALCELQAGIASNDISAAETWAEFLATSLTRLLDSRPSAAPEYLELTKAFLIATAPLPADRFGQYDHRMARSVPGITAFLDTHAKHGDVSLVTGSALRTRHTGATLPKPPNATTVANMRAGLANIAVDEAWYLERYPDVRQAVTATHFASATQHYRQAGYTESRLPAEPDVDQTTYLKRYRDLAKAHANGTLQNAADHFIDFGYREGRLPGGPNANNATAAANARKYRIPHTPANPTAPAPAKTKNTPPPAPAAPHAPATPPASPTTHANAERPTPRKPVAPASIPPPPNPRSAAAWKSPPPATPGTNPATRGGP
jgi:hypothetical protein